MEIRNGVEVLTTLPFRDVALPFDDALELLTQRTNVAVEKNFDSLRSKQDDNPNREIALRKIDELQAYISETAVPGGFSMTEAELRIVYEKMGDLSYDKIVHHFGEQILPKFFKEPQWSRAPGNIITGYLLDLCQVVDPQFASYEERVRVTEKSLSSAGISAYDMGICLDDAVNLRGSFHLPHEFFIDAEEVKKFMQLYVDSLSPTQRSRFKQGFNSDIEDIINTSGFSEN